MEKRRILPLGLGGGFFILPLLLIAATFILLGAWEGWKVWQDYQHFLATEGEVIGNVLLTSQVTNLDDSAASYNSNTFHAVVSFQTKDGTEVTFTEGGGSYPAKYDIGEKVIIMYNPNAPSNAMIRSWEVWFAPILFIVIGVLPVVSLGIFSMVGSSTIVRKEEKRNQNF